LRTKGEVVGAVDFGSREVRVLIARKDDDGVVHIVGHGTAPGRGCVSQGVIQDLNAAQLAFKSALHAAEKEAHTRVTAIFCGINGKNVETFIREGSVQLEREIVEHKHMEEALDVASRDVLAPGKRVTSSVSAQEWYVDDLRVIDPQGIRGQVLKARVHFARLPTVIEDNIATCIEAHKREMEDVIFLPLAASLGCLTPEDMELGVAVLDLGRSTAGLAVYRDYRILGTHCFEWGGYHLTRDVAAGLQISFEEADALILEYGISDAFIQAESEPKEPQGRPVPAAFHDPATARVKLKTAVHGAPTVVDREMLDMIICERAKELMTKVRQHLHSRGLMKHLVRGVVLTGGASQIKNHDALAEVVFQVPCRVGLPNSVEIHTPVVCSPEYSAAIGIVRHAYDYRTAVANGRIDGKGPNAGGLRSLGRLFKKYFF
jgi:cell division protein FtsA